MANANQVFFIDIFFINIFKCVYGGAGGLSKNSMAIYGGKKLIISAMGMCRRGVKAVLNVFLRLNVVVGVE